ncbi:MAG TPA: SUMF1/EgtB/PvdO family nonheme iron enzyme [Pyrinomonadaceae bacterium]
MSHARRVPRGVWLAAGACALLLAIPVTYFALRPDPGWTVVVHGAPTGSDVFVDNIRRGVTHADGTVRVTHLRAGNRLLRVAHAGFGEFVQTVAGTDGETKDVHPKLTSEAAAIAELPAEIDYGGPMALVPAGEFVMGADDREENERPAHRVTLPDFYVDKYEVTNAQYKKFCEETGRELPLNPWWTRQSLGTEDYLNAFPDSPVIGVSWEDAAAYARWAGKRLPTEEEWEKAASWGRGARAKRRWPWGDAFEQGRANVGTAKPVPVAGFAAGASAYGVLNMAGNVSEWVESEYRPYEGGRGGDPRYGAGLRVTRGGSFRGSADEVRTSRRDAAPPDSRTQPSDVVNRVSWLIGFRCAVSAGDPQLQKFLGERGP